MARPTKLTPATADGICQRLRAGVPLVHAAKSMGVDRGTMSRVCLTKRGKGG